MKTGSEYAFSPEKRAFDVALAGFLLPAVYVGERILPHVVDYGTEDLKPIFTQPRPGVGGQVFEIQKFRTLDSKSQPIGKLARLMRKFGIDEIPQIRNILAGEMSFTGHRPLREEEHEKLFENAPDKLVDRWNNIVAPTKPGVFSTFATLNHKTPHLLIERAPLKLWWDIYDVQRGSVVNDIQTILMVANTAIRGQT